MGFLFGQKTASNSENKISTLSIQTSSQGVPIPIVYGETRVSVNHIWYGDFTAIGQTQKQGGKGGGGGTTSTNYVYTVGLLQGVCEGPIVGIGQVWQNKDVYASTAPLSRTVFLGSYTQTAWSYMTTHHPTEALGYRGIAYLGDGALALGSSGSVPNMTYEVQGFGYDQCRIDVTPEEVMVDLLPNANYGAGFPSAQMAAWTDFYNYCLAAGILVSPAYTAQRTAAEIAMELAQIGNTAPVWSEGLLKMIPYADQAITGTISALSPPSFGFTFTPENIIAANTWNSIASNGTNLAAVGGNGTASASTDSGVTWAADAFTFPAGGGPYAMAFTGSNFLAVGYDGGFNFCVALSSDGVTWSYPTSYNGIACPNVFPGINGGSWVCPMGNGTAVCIMTDGGGGYNGNVTATAGTNCLVWVKNTTTLPNKSWRAGVGIRSGSLAGKFVVAASDASNSAVSTDGATWTASTNLAASLGGSCKGMACNPAAPLLVAVGNGANCAISADGLTWTQHAMPVNTDWRSIAWDGSQFLAVGYTASFIMASSPDGSAWTQHVVGNPYGSWDSVCATPQAGRFAMVQSGSATSAIVDMPAGVLFCTPTATTFTPTLTINYDLTDDDFISPSGEDPIKVARKRQADAFNSVQVECFNRDNSYNLYVAEAKDQASIDLYGLRQMPVATLHAICTPAIGRTVAQIILQRALYIRNAYEFTLGWKYARLEPMDLVSLTDAGLGMLLYTVRITSTEEDEDGNIKVTAEDFNVGVSNSATYATQAPTGYTVNNATDPGNANPPVIFQPPLALTSSPQIWLGTSGGANWGGAQVWASTDGTTYNQAGTITSPARHGLLTAPIVGTAISGSTITGVATSALTWTPTTLAAPPITNLYRSASDGTILVALPAAGVTGIRYNPATGANTQITMPSNSTWYGVCWSGTQFCAIANSSTAAATSPDGITWTARALPSADDWFDIAWNGTVFCAIARFCSMAATSPDGIAWTPRTLPSIADWQAIVWNGTVFCIISAIDGKSATSPDGITWTPHAMPINAHWSSMAWNGSTYCAVAIAQYDAFGNLMGPFAATSADGATWVLQNSMPVGTGTYIAWNGSKFCSVGTFGAAASSPDGVTWTAQTLPATPSVWAGIVAVGATFSSYELGGATAIASATSAVSTPSGTTVVPPAVSVVDAANTLSVDLMISAGALESVTATQAAALSTLCYVDGELLAYTNANLTSAYHYDLTNLYRGQYGTPSAAHATGTKFMRLDGSVVAFVIDSSYVGKTAYIKLLSFNLLGGGVQNLANVQPTIYTVQPLSGSAPSTIVNAGAPGSVATATVLYIPFGTNYTVTSRMTVNGTGRINNCGRLTIT